MKIAFLTSADAQAKFSEIVSHLEEVGSTIVFVEPSSELPAILLAEKPAVCYVDASLGANAEDVCELLEALNIGYAGSYSFTRKMLADPRAIVRNLETYAELSGEYVSAWAPEGKYISNAILTAFQLPQIADVVEQDIPGGFPVHAKLSKGSVLATVNSKEELQEIIAAAIEYEADVYLFQKLDGVKLLVPVLGSGYNAYALAPVEADTLHVPVRSEILSSDEAVAQAIRAEIERASLEAYRVCGLQDFGCVELVWDGAQATIVGINAQPEISVESAFGQACSLAGITIPGLFDALLSE